MLTRTRVSFAVLLMTLASLLAIAAPASAKRAPTRIIIRGGSPFFHGVVRSPRNGCRIGRTVKLYREELDADELIYTDSTDANGEWLMEIGANTSSGAYYVLAPPTGGCKPGKSEVVGYP